MFPNDAKILIADDMPTIRDLLKSQLKAMNFTNTIEANDGEQALNLLIQHGNSSQPVDLVISDWNMPKLSGFELLRQVRASKEFADLPFVLLTSETERDHVTAAIFEGVSQYIVKPFSAKSLEEKLRLVWTKQSNTKKR